VGDIVEAGGASLAVALMEDCVAVAASQGFAPRPAAVQQTQVMLTAPGSMLAASMFRDIERNAPVEADHMIGDLVRRAEEKQIDIPLLRVAYAHLKAYEARRSREAGLQS
jgi:2-dehydropantoate 2-reductase